jgi:predicted N-acetyltransferase YhbS
MRLRPEIVGDYGAITRVNNLAFQQPNEGRLVSALRGLW